MRCRPSIVEDLGDRRAHVFSPLALADSTASRRGARTVSPEEHAAAGPV
jgi:hypothetical protein